MEIVPIVAILSTFGSSAFVIYTFLKTRNRERMALIESGQDASIFKESDRIHTNLKWGYLAIAVGIALFIGHFLEEFTTMDDGAGYFSMIFLLGGLAFILYYSRAKRDGLGGTEI